MEIGQGYITMTQKSGRGINWRNLVESFVSISTSVLSLLSVQYSSDLFKVYVFVPSVLFF